MTQIQQAHARMTAATAAVLALLDRAILDPSLEAAIGIEGQISVKQLKYLRENLTEHRAKLDAAIADGNRSRAELEAMDPQPSALDLDQIGMSVREDSPLGHALRDQLAAGVSLSKLIGSAP